MTVGVVQSYAARADGPFRSAALLGAVLGCRALLSLRLGCTNGLLLARAMRQDAQ